MNYYEHHLGDYAAATGHLSWDEDMAYTRLLRAYYHHERPIKSGQQYRIARAQTAAQRKAVDAVLDEFFVLEGGEWRQKRADEEIGRYQDKQNKARRSANARWHGKQSDSDRNANASKLSTADAMRTHTEGNALQTPDTIQGNTESTPLTRARAQGPVDNSEPVRENPQGPPSLEGEGFPPPPAAADPPPPDDDPPPGEPTKAGVICRALREAGVARTNPGHPRLQALLELGAQPDEFLGFVEKAKGTVDPFAYVLGCVEGERKRAREIRERGHAGVMPANGSAAVGSSVSVAESRQVIAALSAAAQEARSPAGALAREAAMRRWRKQRRGEA